MKIRGQLLVISAPSGGGKTTIVQEILKRFPAFRFSVSATTREKRKGETDGKDYFFLTRAEFEKKIADGDLVEHEEIYSNYYGTLKSEIEKALTNGENIVFDVDVNGALSIKKKFPEAILIFVRPPTLEILRNRLEGRGSESAEQVNRRMARVPMELEKGAGFDYIVINDDLKRAVDEVFEIVAKHLSQGSREKEYSGGTKAD
ncbi:MAG TPA: guanylate kinase [Candidatus Kryptonia bacterium]